MNKVIERPHLHAATPLPENVIDTLGIEFNDGEHTGINILPSHRSRINRDLRYFMLGKDTSYRHRHDKLGRTLGRLHPPTSHRSYLLVQNHHEITGIGFLPQYPLSLMAKGKGLSIFSTEARAGVSLQLSRSDKNWRIRDSLEHSHFPEGFFEADVAQMDWDVSSFLLRAGARVSMPVAKAPIQMNNFSSAIKSLSKEKDAVSNNYPANAIVDKWIKKDDPFVVYYRYGDDVRISDLDRAKLGSEGYYSPKAIMDRAVGSFLKEIDSLGRGETGEDKFIEHYGLKGLRSMNITIAGKRLSLRECLSILQSEEYAEWVSKDHGPEDANKHPQFRQAVYMYAAIVTGIVAYNYGIVAGANESGRAQEELKGWLRTLNPDHLQDIGITGRQHDFETTLMHSDTPLTAEVLRKVTNDAAPRRNAVLAETFQKIYVCFTGDKSLPSDAHWRNGVRSVRDDLAAYQAGFNRANPNN